MLDARHRPRRPTSLSPYHRLLVGPDNRCINFSFHLIKVYFLGHGTHLSAGSNPAFLPFHAALLVTSPGVSNSSVPFPPFPSSSQLPIRSERQEARRLPPFSRHPREDLTAALVRFSVPEGRECPPK